MHLSLHLLLRVQPYLRQNPKISQHYMYPKEMSTEKRESQVDKQLFELTTKYVTNLMVKYPYAFGIAPYAKSFQNINTSKPNKMTQIDASGDKKYTFSAGHTMFHLLITIRLKSASIIFIYIKEILIAIFVLDNCYCTHSNQVLDC